MSELLNWISEIHTTTELTTVIPSSEGPTISEVPVREETEPETLRTTLTTTAEKQSSSLTLHTRTTSEPVQSTVPENEHTTDITSQNSVVTTDMASPYSAGSTVGTFHNCVCTGTCGFTANMTQLHKTLNAIRSNLTIDFKTLKRYKDHTFIRKWWPSFGKVRGIGRNMCDYRSDSVYCSHWHYICIWMVNGKLTVLLVPIPFVNNIQRLTLVLTIM